MKPKLLLATLLFFYFCLLSSQVPQGFNYQAIARDASGNPIINTALPVRITIQSDSLGGTTFWIEEHILVTTNNFGLFTLILGKGVKKTGSTAVAFNDIDWTGTPKFIKTEIDYSGWKTMGSSRLWSVPYSMVSGSLAGPVKKLEVTGVTSVMDEALFEVKNKTGQTVFAVYNEGVRVYVDDGVAKGVKGGFAIGGFGTAKTPSQNYFVVKPDTIRMYIDDTPGKAVKGGFAIGGFGTGKGTSQHLFVVNPDSIRAYIDTNTVKGVKGGFAIGGFGTGKALGEEYLRVTRDSTRIYINDKAKAVKGGFAIGGFGTGKGGNANFFNVETSSTGIINPPQNRVVWYPIKNAFWAGRVLIENPDSVGVNSFATGYESKAIGQYSQALGYQSIARGDYSTAIGKNAVASKINSFAFGEGAFAGNEESYAIGRGATATGYRSFAFGSAGVDSAGNATDVARALGDYSFAIGQGSQAIGKGAIALGIAASASAEFSIALGYKTHSSHTGGTAIGYNTLSYSFFSTALGYSTIASQTGSTAMGYMTIASGYSSTAMGYGTIANETSSTAMGCYTTASGGFSTAMGKNTRSSGEYSTSMGKYTISKPLVALTIGQYNDTTCSLNGNFTWTGTDPLFICGNGNSNTDRKNAFTIYKNGNANVQRNLVVGSWVLNNDRLDVFGGVNAGGWITYNNSLNRMVIGLIQSLPSDDDGAYCGWLNSGLGHSAGTLALIARSQQDCDISFYTGNGTPTEKMTVKYDGNVGIGTISPQSILDVRGPITGNNMYSASPGDAGIIDVAGDKLILYESAGPFVWRAAIGMSTVGPYLQGTGGSSTDGIRFITGQSTATEQMRITRDGNVGIGTTSPGQKLDIVAGYGRVQSGYSWLTNSDVRFKKNIYTLEDCLEKVMTIRGVSYDLKSDSLNIGHGMNNIGFIAQELENVIPEVVVTGSDGYKSVAYDKITVVLTEAIKEQQKQIEGQQKEIDELKALVNSLVTSQSGQGNK
jgi:hypothetical protein